VASGSAQGWVVASQSGWHAKVLSFCKRHSVSSWQSFELVHGA
jgi:hypothetical protein